MDPRSNEDIIALAWRPLAQGESAKDFARHIVKALTDAGRLPDDLDLFTLEQWHSGELHLLAEGWAVIDGQRGRLVEVGKHWDSLGKPVYGFVPSEPVSPGTDRP